MSQADTLVEQGMKLHQGGQAAEAEALFRQALEAQPTHKMALYMLGNLLNARGDFENGVAFLQRAVEAYPDFAEAYYSLGAVFVTQRRQEASIQAFTKAVEARPDFLEAHQALSNLYLQKGVLPEAEVALKNVVRLKPEAAEALWHLGSIYQRTNRIGMSLDCFRQIIKLRPDDMQAHLYVAGLAQFSGHYEEAAASYERCIAGNLKSAEIFINLGALYCQLERYEEAEQQMRAALTLLPENAKIHHNLGAALYKQGKLSDAKMHYHRASTLSPGEVQTQRDRWNILLLNGDYDQGWEVYEAWMRLGLFKPRAFAQPHWDGSAHPDKTLLVYADHGFGDAIQFVRYLPLVKQRFQGQVVLECQSSLCALFQTCPGVDAVIARNPDNSPPDLPFDLRVGLMSLASLFQTTEETIPTNIPYLSVPAERLERWKARLPRDGRLHVGLRWAGNPGHGDDKNRSVRLNDFAALARIPALRLFSLQTEQAAEQVATPPDDMKIIDLMPEVSDFLDTAAIIQNLDLVITVDTAIAHLSGALGVPTWTLLPFLPDWRWLMEREDTPWYPTMRLFRQPERRNWFSVFERVANDLTRDSLTHAAEPNSPAPFPGRSLPLAREGGDSALDSPLSRSAGEGAGG